MIRIGVLLILSFALSLLTGEGALAHGINYSTSNGGVVVSVVFDGGVPAAKMSVSVFAPNAIDCFQSGKTDGNGRFAFCPDQAGNWTVLVYDSMGHRVEINVAVDDEFVVKKSSEPQGASRYAKIGLGLVLIFGVFWGIAIFKGKGRMRQ